MKNGFYNDTRFFRVLDGFMAQFGLHADPTIQSAWRSANLKDEPVKKSNTRGFVSFTRESSPNSRYTMIFVNYKDNSYLDADGFAPFGQVVSGMEVLDRLYSGYGRQNIPDQRRILREGNAYLLAEYPKLDFVKTATIDDRCRHHESQLRLAGARGSEGSLSPEDPARFARTDPPARLRGSRLTRSRSFWERPSRETCETGP